MNWSKLFFGVGGIICLLLRVFLIFTNIDPTTGFYVHGGFVLSFYSTLLILSLLIIVGYGLFVMKPSAFRVNQPALLSFASAFCGTMILLNSGLGFIDFLSEIFRWSDPMGYVTDNVLLVVLQLLRLLIGLSAGASLISYAITGGNMLRRSGFLLTPAVWTMRAILRWAIFLKKTWKQFWKSFIQTSSAPSSSSFLTAIQMPLSAPLMICSDRVFRLSCRLTRMLL